MIIKAKALLEVDLDQEELNTVVEDRLRKIVKARDSYFLKDNKIYESVYCSSHNSYWEENFVRDATEHDIIVFRAIKLLQTSHD